MMFLKEASFGKVIKSNQGVNLNGFTKYQNTKSHIYAGCLSWVLCNL